MAATFTMYKDNNGDFRWNLRHSNGNVIADSGQGYKSKESAIAGITSVK